MKQYQVLEISGPDKITWTTWDKRDLYPDELLIKVSAFAICTSEQGIYTGARKAKYPVYMGHEVVGEIAEVGKDVPGFAEGEVVAISPLGRCGVCHNCRKGLDNACLNKAKLVREGKAPGPAGFAEYMIIPAYQAFKLTKDIDLTAACMAEPVACCLSSVDKGNVDFGDNVLVVGAGIMGLIHIKLLKLRGARVIVSEPNAQRREVALKYGADDAIDPAEDFGKAIDALTDGVGLQGVFLTGGPSGIVPEILNSCAIGAAVVIYTSYQGANKPAVELDLNKIHYGEINLVGTVSPKRYDFQRAAALVKNREIDLGKLIEKVYAKEEVEAAFQHAIKPDSFRIVVRMS